MTIKKIRNPENNLYYFFVIPKEENYEFLIGISKKNLGINYAKKKFKNKIKEFYVFNKKRNGGINPKRKGFKS